MTKDGQTVATGNIPMGNNRITGMGAGTAATDAANLTQVQTTAAKLLTVSGTDTITASGTPTVAAYTSGAMYYFSPAATNTGAVTINIDSLGAKNITKEGSTALAAGDLTSGKIAVIVYDGTRFQLVNAGASSSTGNITFAGNTVSTSNTNGNVAFTPNGSGAVLVGTTSSIWASANNQMEILGGTGGVKLNPLVVKTPLYYTCTLLWNATTTDDPVLLAFGTESSYTVRGNITYNRSGGVIAYNTTSDYRLKDVYGPVTDSGEKIDAIKIYRGKMHGATLERPMAIAHELAEQAPYAVTGKKDGVHPETGEPMYQQVDYTTLVPLLVAEIQSLRARVAALEAK